ncbi:MAG: hemerythrin family protein [Desulfobacteraceae bacterium]|nr:hemerythrin family protein [Desulfobacteraceae bacterium]
MLLEQKYFTGVIWQDFQHKEMMELFAKLRKARADKKDKDAFRFTVAFLSMYANHHFKLEEEYMDIYYYPEKESHKKEHKEYIKTLKKFRANHKEYSEEAVDKLIKKINKWILDHIFGDDKKLGQYILDAEKTNKE